MDIQQLAQIGNERKAAILAESRRVQAEREQKRQNDWREIFDWVEKYIPADFYFSPAIPDYGPDRYGSYKQQSFDIPVPDSDAWIHCNPDGRQPKFTAKAPKSTWDEEGKMGWFVAWKRTDYDHEDFLIALAEAVEAAEQLPAVRSECDRKNAEWMAKEEEPTPQPAEEKTDWLAEAENFYHQSQDSTIAAALIAIAHELRRMNDRADTAERRAIFQA